MEKTRSLCSPTADANFVADSGIAGTAASATASTFCARKFNKETNAKLHLVRVVSALERLRFGYFRQLLRLEVLDEGVAKIYSAVVESKSGGSDMRLVNFLEVEVVTISLCSRELCGRGCGH
ncbi:hypothetical protein ACFX2I_015323 [Malus domestica]